MPSRTRCRAFAIVVALVSLSSACSSSSTSRPSPGTTGSSQAIDPYLQDFDNGQPCPASQAAGIPSGSGCLSDVRVDLNGDGRPDRFVVFASLDADHMPTSWNAVALFGGGHATGVTAIPFGAQVEGQSNLYPRVIGAFDADGDGRPEVFVKLTGVVYHIAVSHIVGMFRVAADGIHQVEIEGTNGPEPWHFFTGGTSRRGQAVVCTKIGGRPALLVRLIQVVPPERWSWSEQTLFWKDGILQPDGLRHGFYPQSVSIADPRVVAFFKLRCGAVTLE